MYKVEITSLHPALCKYAAMMWDYLSYFIDSVEEKDIFSATSDPKCQFRQYEKSRIEHVLSGIKQAAS